MIRPVDIAKRGLFLACILISCGGQSSKNGNATEAPGSSVAGGASASPHEPAVPEDEVHCEPGATRDATPEEGADYCICPPDTSLWTCYGPDPRLNGNTKVRCDSQYSSGTDPQSCLLSYAKCADARTYLIACTRGFCTCVIDADPVARLEPGVECPETVQMANELCGWELRVGQ